jgi:hypothetical protein
MVLSLYFILYGSTYDSKQLSLPSPSRNKASFMEKSAFKKNGLILQSSVRNPEFAIWFTLCILTDSYKKRPDSWTWTHEILDWRMEYGSAITEKNVLFTPSLKYVSRHADHFFICKNEHLEKNLYTKASALRKIY